MNTPHKSTAIATLADALHIKRHPASGGLEVRYSTVQDASPSVDTVTFGDIGRLIGCLQSAKLEKTAEEILFTFASVPSSINMHRFPVALTEGSLRQLGFLQAGYRLPHA